MSALQKINFCLYALGTPRRAYPTRSGAIPPLCLLCYGTTHGLSPTRSGAMQFSGLLRRKNFLSLCPWYATQGVPYAFRGGTSPLPLVLRDDTRVVPYAFRGGKRSRSASQTKPLRPYGHLPFQGRQKK